MDSQELRKLLEELHAEIKNTGAVDENGTEMLRDLDEEIHALLLRSGDRPIEEHEPLQKHLQDTFDYFEVSHPSLTKVVSRLLEFLSDTGI